MPNSIFFLQKPQLKGLHAVHVGSGNQVAAVPVLDGIPVVAVDGGSEQKYKEAIGISKPKSKQSFSGEVPHVSNKNGWFPLHEQSLHKTTTFPANTEIEDGRDDGKDEIVHRPRSKSSGNSSCFCKQYLV